MTEYMLPEVPAHLLDGRLKIEIRMPWYRALPLSSVTNVKLTVDEIECDADEIKFHVNDHEYALGELPPLSSDWWYVLDSAWLSIPVAADFKPGKHTVQLSMGLYIPYLPVGPFILVVSEDLTKELEVVAE